MMRGLACLALGLATANVAVAAQRHCMFGGKWHASGAIVCADGKQQQCKGGTWKSLGTTCARGTGHVMPGVEKPHVKHAASPPQPAEPRQPGTPQPPTP